MTNPFRKTAVAAFENQTRDPVIIDGEVVVPGGRARGSNLGRGQAHCRHDWRPLLQLCAEDAMIYAKAALHPPHSVRRAKEAWPWQRTIGNKSTWPSAAREALKFKSVSRGNHS